MKTPSAVLMGMGAFLIFAGVAQVFYQMRRYPMTLIRTKDGERLPGPDDVWQTARVTVRGFQIQSAYPGMTMIAVGAGLMLAGAWFSN